MGWDRACTAVIAALRADATLAALTVLDNPADEVTADLTVMVHPFGGTFAAFSLDGYAPSGDVRIALATRERPTTAGGFAADMAAIRPYADLVPKALARAYAANHFAGTVVACGDEATPWLRMDRPTREQVNGQDLLMLRFSLAVTLPEEDWA